MPYDRTEVSIGTAPPRGRHRGPARPWGDAALALLVLFLDAVALAVTTMWVYVATRPDSDAAEGARPKAPEMPGDAPRPAPGGRRGRRPGAVGGLARYIGFAIAAGLIALTAYAFVRGGHRITAGAQILVVVLLVLGALHSAAREARGTHPGPVPVPAGDRCVCHSAGGSCHGRGSH
ncbi:hypothetical protein [Streptomyces sp. NPDC001970]